MAPDRPPPQAPRVLARSREPRRHAVHEAPQTHHDCATKHAHGMDAKLADNVIITALDQHTGHAHPPPHTACCHGWPTVRKPLARTGCPSMVASASGPAGASSPDRQHHCPQILHHLSIYAGIVHGTHRCCSSIREEHTAAPHLGRQPPLGRPLRRAWHQRPSTSRHNTGGLARSDRCRSHLASIFRDLGPLSRFHSC